MGTTRRCRLHGGKSLSGIAHPKFKHGRRSKSIPARLMGSYSEALTDPQLLELGDEVALIDARLNDMLTRVEQGDSPDLWHQLRATYKDLHKAIFVEVDQTQMIAALNVMERLINRGIADWAAWQEIQNTIEQRRRLVESERKRLDQMEQLVTVSEMMVLASALLSSVQIHVTDRRALAAISADFTRLVTIDGQKA